jgi:preprotein translocase subunit YajC
MIKNVRRGDTIVSTGGIVGKVTKVTDDPELEVEIADGVRVKLVRAMISEVRTKGEPVRS